jgi:adenylate kinase
MDGRAGTAAQTTTKIGPVILLGAPGAGKGTQAKLIMQRYGVPQISTGDILRDSVARGTELGKKAKAFMDKGELVPDQLVCDMVADRLRQADCAQGFILDGFPRTVAQAEWLDGLLKGEFFEKRCAVAPLVLNIQVGYNQLLRRLTGRRTCPTCGRIYNVYFQPPRVADTCDVDGSKLVTRKDDSEEVIAERLKAYERQTLALIDYYRRQERLREVDGDQAPDQVTAETFRTIENGNRL